MRDAFPGRYRPTQTDFDRLWREGLFVLDTNVLLSMYRRYYSEYRTELIVVLRGLEDRLWMPHQVAYEYLNLRLKEIEKVRTNYAGMRKQLTDAEQDADTEEAKRSLASSTAYFDELEAGFPKPSNSPEDDDVWSAIDELFDGKVGPPYDPEEKAKILEQGEQRYTDRVPPGYKDQGKGKGEEKYGDLLIWFQMLKKAEQDTRPIVFVTHDQKEDWWWKSPGGGVIGPRHELVEEMRHRAGVAFHMYQVESFLERAGTFLNREVSKEAIDEAHKLAELEAEEEEREEALSRLAGAVATGGSTNASDMGSARIPSPSAPPDVAAAQAAHDYLNSPAAQAARDFMNSPQAQAARDFMNSPQMREIHRIQEQLRRMGL